MRIRISSEAECEDSECEKLRKDLQTNKAILGIGSVYTTSEKVLHISEISINKFLFPYRLENK